MLRGKLTPLVLLLAASALTAQETTGSLTGHIYEKTGRSMRDIVVRISSPAMLGERTAVSSESGQFRFPVLPTGHYTLTASSSGFVTFRAKFQVLAGQVQRQDVVLVQVAEARKVKEATVEVVAEIPQVDKTETVTTTTFSMEGLAQMESQ